MGDTIFLNYVGGLPVGAPGGVWLSLMESPIYFEDREGKPEKCWSHELPFADIAAVNFETGESVSLARMAAVGIFAFALKNRGPLFGAACQDGRN